MLNQLKIEKTISANGYMEVTIIITPKGNIHKLPIVTFRGLPVNDTDEFLFGLENEIENHQKLFSYKKQKTRI